MFSLGRFNIEEWDHPDLLKAREQDDQEKVSSIIATLRQPDGTLDTSGYVRVAKLGIDNLNTIEGVKYAFDLITGVETTAPTWYIGEFEADDVPDTGWTSNWGAVSGGDTTEFTDYDEASRPQCVFTAATGTTRISATNPVRAQVTVSTGVVNQSIYGVCLTTAITKQYAGGAAYLLAATRYPAVRTYNAGEVKYLGYEIYMP